MAASSSSGVRIEVQSSGRGLRATRAFAVGSTILVAEGVLRDAPSRLTLQIADDAHLDVPAGAPEDAFVWRYLNHACAPNAAFRGRTLLALRPIEAGEELTFDYETTEWELATPFLCACSSEPCEGREIRGFRHLSPAQRRRRLPQLREDLRRRLLGDA